MLHAYNSFYYEKAIIPVWEIINNSILLEHELNFSYLKTKLNVLSFWRNIIQFSFYNHFEHNSIVKKCFRRSSYFLGLLHYLLAQSAFVKSETRKFKCLALMSKLTNLMKF